MEGAGAASADEVSSPTFTLIHEYGNPVKVYHADLYRLDTAEQVRRFGLEELFEKPALTLIEWGERFPELMPARRTEIRLTNSGEESRLIELRDIFGVTDSFTFLVPLRSILTLYKVKAAALAKGGRTRIESWVGMVKGWDLRRSRPSRLKDRFLIFLVGGSFPLITPLTETKPLLGGAVSHCAWQLRPTERGGQRWARLVL